MNPEDNENDKEENDEGDDNALSQPEPSFTQSQIECLSCHQLSFFPENTPNWLSICVSCLEKTRSKANSLTCCFGSCESDQYDSCPTCKQSFCSMHIPDHDCVLQPEVNNSIDDDDKSLALQPKIDDGDKTIDDPDHMAIDEPDNMAVQPDVADDAQGLFRRRQDFLTSFLKTLTIEETGITVYNSYLFYFV
jgi:hypothetical protein